MTARHSPIIASTDVDTARQLERLKEQVAYLRDLASRADAAQAREITSRIAQLSRQFRIRNNIGIAKSPLAQALELDSTFRNRPHLEYLSARITRAVKDVERGQDRRLVVSMPPRSGKTHLTSFYTPLWMLRRHPEWEIMTASYDPALTRRWASNIRSVIEEKPGLGIALQKDGGAGGQWSTVEGGGMYSSSVRGSMTGLGARVMIIDDPVKDRKEVQSEVMRNALWDWWLSVALTRLQPPSLVIVVATRWHEDDFMGRLLSADYEGDPEEWESVRIPALADDVDPLGRTEGQPLYSPLVEQETEESATQRWEGVRRAVGEYTWAGLYQQRPSPAKGSIFDVEWWKYWTTDPTLAKEDGSVVYLDPDTLTQGTWVDSWDCNFGNTSGTSSSYVVGQRWVRHRADRFLIAQQRGRWSFVETLARMKAWATPPPVHELNPYGHHVHTRLIEKKANGAAIIDTLRRDISGMVPVNPTTSKESRARAITPEVMSGNVFLPHPSESQNSWVRELLSEARNFPNGTNDDQVDALTQALDYLRTATPAQITVPSSQVDRDRVKGLKSQSRRITSPNQRVNPRR